MKDLKKFLLSHKSSIVDAISLLEKNASQIVLVTKTSKLIGTITDGDIRRAIIKKINLDTSVEKIMNKKFVTLDVNASSKQALSLMRNKTLRQIPVVNKKGEIKKVFLMDQLIRSNSRINDVVIMAGGKGLRLGNLTKNCPKPMLKVNNKPILEIILEQCIEAGFKNFYFTVNYLKNKIIDYFNDGSRWGVKINYIVEKTPLGTAGSLSFLKNKTKKPILLLNGDILTKVDFNNLYKFYKTKKSAITVCTKKHITTVPYGVLEVNNFKVLGLEEKPALFHFVNAGIYMIDPKILKMIKDDTYLDMVDLIKIAKNKKFKITAFPIHEYWQDIGLPEKLIQTHKDWK